MKLRDTSKVGIRALLKGTTVELVREEQEVDPIHLGATRLRY